MPNENQNTGSFGAGLGGIDALKAAMQKRGMDASVLDQVSASAPTGPSAVAPAIGQDANNVMSQTPQAPQEIAGEQGPQTRSGEMEIALKALAQTVSTENTIAKQALKLAAPPQPLQ